MKDDNGDAAQQRDLKINFRFLVDVSLYDVFGGGGDPLSPVATLLTPPDRIFFVGRFLVCVSRICEETKSQENETLCCVTSLRLTEPHSFGER